MAFFSKLWGGNETRLKIALFSDHSSARRLEIIATASPMALQAGRNNLKHLAVWFRNADSPVATGIVHVFVGPSFVELEGHGKIEIVSPEGHCVLEE